MDRQRGIAVVGGWEVAGFTGPTLQGSENSISEQVCQICRGQMLAEQGVSHWVILFIHSTNTGIGKIKLNQGQPGRVRDGSGRFGPWSRD